MSNLVIDDAAYQTATIRELAWRDTAPIAYKLGRKPDGELVLLGAFRWQKGGASGTDWEELPTEALP